MPRTKCVVNNISSLKGFFGKGLGCYQYIVPMGLH